MDLEGIHVPSGLKLTFEGADVLPGADAESGEGGVRNDDVIGSEAFRGVSGDWGGDGEPAAVGEEGEEMVLGGRVNRISNRESRVRRRLWKDSCPIESGVRQI